MSREKGMHTPVWPLLHSAPETAGDWPWTLTEKGKAGHEVHFFLFEIK